MPSLSVTLIRPNWHTVRWLAGLLAVLATLVALRLYRLPEALLFFNDIGRDYLELWEWQTTGLPPLLGPQTSALPFNQSAFYFYLLFPGYLLTNGSPYASTYTWLGVIVGLIAWVWWLTRHHRSWWGALLTVITLVTIHPQVIIQSRFVWNPSFAFLATLVAIGSWLALERSWSRWVAILWGIAVAWGISLSYSVAPVMALLLLRLSWRYRLKSWWLWASGAVMGGILNLPTLAFELRHDFTLTKLMLHGEKLAQSGLDWPIKLHQLSNYLLGSSQTSVLIFLGVSLVIMIGWSVKWYLQRHQIAEHIQLQRVVSVGILALGLTLVIPVAIQTHYIFGLLAILAWIIASCPKPLGWSWLVLAALIWLSPQQLSVYFAPARRTVVELQTCAAQVCQQHQEPLFVSVQSDFHPFHSGPEHRYFLSQAGCAVKKIETEPTAAQTMAVVVDDSLYVHGQTAYHELTQFGTSTESAVINCTPKLQVHLLQRQ